VEITSVVGPVLSVLTLVITAKLKHLELSALFTWAGSTIIGLGTSAALVNGYTKEDIIYSLKAMNLFLKGPDMDKEGLVAEIQNLAQLARKDGFLALEKQLEGLSDEFLKKGVQMLVDNTEPSTIQEVLEGEIALLFEEEEIAVKFYEDMGAFSPTVGIIGAVLGLMMVMQNLSNPDAIGPGIAAAFTATIWGVAVANLFALPAAKKLKRFCLMKKLFREVAAVGVLGIAHSHPPKALVERIRSMLGLEAEG
jgi:chemotaxis protein MotA